MFFIIIIFSGLNDNIFGFFGLSAYEISLIMIFVFCILHSLLVKNKYFISINKLDKQFFSLFIMLSILPLIANFIDFIDSGNPDYKDKLYLIRLFIVYSIFTYSFISIFNRGFNYSANYIKGLLEIIIIIGAISGFVGVLRFIPGSINGMINTIWPLGKYIGFGQRLLSTVGSINTGGIFFCIMSIISFYLYAYFKKSKYLILFSMHTFFVLLTGSFSAIGTYLIVLSIMSFHYRIFKFINIVKLLSTLLIISIILFNIPLVKDSFTFMVEKRIAGRIISAQFHTAPVFTADSFIPANLSGRYEDWGKIMERLWVEKPIFGWGFKETDLGSYAQTDIDVNHARVTLSESFYFELLLYSGLAGLIAYIIFIRDLLIKSKSKKILHGSLFKYIIMAILISQITQISSFYSGIMEIIALLMSLIYCLDLLNKYETKMQNKFIRGY